MRNPNRAWVKLVFAIVLIAVIVAAAFIANALLNQNAQTYSEPTIKPTPPPTSPTNQPTAPPTHEPSNGPTSQPTTTPTESPTETPSTPTATPTPGPTNKKPSPQIVSQNSSDWLVELESYFGVDVVVMNLGGDGNIRVSADINAPAPMTQSATKYVKASTSETFQLRWDLGFGNINMTRPVVSNLHADVP